MNEYENYSLEQLEILKQSYEFKISTDIGEDQKESFRNILSQIDEEINRRK